jgi:hypothetical protein
LWSLSIPMSTGRLGIGVRPVLKLRQFFRGIELGLKLRPTRAELRGTLLLLTGFAITILFLAGGASLWRAEYGRGSLLVAVGGGLTFAFFRKWKADLVIIGLIFIGINAGLTAVFHPSVPGILITVASGVGIVALGRWVAGRPRQG